MTASPGSRRSSLFIAIMLVGAVLVAGSCGKPSPIVVGGLVSETGTAASYGKEIKQGMNLALEEQNARGGFPNRRDVMIEYRDDGSSPERARAAAKELVTTRHANAIVGGITSGIAQAVMPLIVDREVVMLSPSASSPHLTAIGAGWFFRIYPSDMAEVEVVADLVSKLGIQKIAIVAHKEPFGQNLAEIFGNQVDVAGGKVIAREDFDLPLLPADARVIAKKVVLSGANAVYIASYRDEVAVMLQELQTEGFKGVKLTSSSVTPEIVRLAGASAERLVFPQGGSELESAPVAAKFTENFKKKYGGAPGSWSAYGYDAMNVFCEALRQTRLASAGEIRSALVAIDYPGVTGPIKFDTRGDIQREPHLYAVVHGDLMNFEASDPGVRGMLVP